MKEDLISYETSVLAKECGFDWKVISFFTDYHKYPVKSYTGYSYKCKDFKNRIYFGYNCSNEFEMNFNKIKYFTKLNENLETDEFFQNIYSAPTQSKLQRWLRDIHSIEVFVHCRNLKVGWVVKIRDLKTMKKLFQDVFVNYESALEKGLLESLKIIREKK